MSTSKPRTKTATIHRCHKSGRYELHVKYRGKIIHWTDFDQGSLVFGGTAYAIVQDGYPDSMDIAKRHAVALGFTHYKLSWDFPTDRKPRSGKL